MRQFTTQENDWIKLFVYTKRKGLSAIQELQPARILRKNFEFFALKWTYGDYPQVTLYNKKQEERIIEHEYYKICDFIYFIKELETCGFVAIQKVSSKSEDKGYSVLYDKDDFDYNASKDRFELKEAPKDDFTQSLQTRTSVLEDFGNGSYGISSLTPQEINLDFALLLQKYSLGIIYPLPLAEDYVDHNFKTLEQRHYEKQIKEAEEQTKIAVDSANTSADAAKTANKSYWIAVFTFIITIAFNIYNSCSSQKSENEHINRLIRLENAIKSNHITEPLKVGFGDSIAIKPLEVKVHLDAPQNNSSTQK